MGFPPHVNQRNLSGQAHIIFRIPHSAFRITIPLHDVQRNAIKMDAGAAGHTSTLTNYCEPGAIYFLLFFHRARLAIQLAPTQGLENVNRPAIGDTIRECLSIDHDGVVDTDHHMPTQRPMFV
jgi:hypothetical protein